MKDAGLVEPVEKKMGDFTEIARAGVYPVQIQRSCLFYTVPLRETLTNLLNSKSVQEHFILPSQSVNVAGVLRNIFDGQKFRSLPNLPQGRLNF